MSNEILYTGVNIPPETKNYMNRQRINDLLKYALEKPLVVVLANAGFGKTQSVANFFKSNIENIKLSWFKINELDNLLSRYSERFIYASAISSKEFSEELLTLELPFTEYTYKKYLDILDKFFVTTKKKVLVLDDYHFITNPEILFFLENHVLLNIPNFVVVLITRSEPNFNLKKLDEEGLVSFITEDDLQFTKDEMTKYFRSLDIFITNEDVDYLYSYTEGWVFAINTLAQLLKEINLKNENLILSLKLKTSDYIENEIFYNFSEDMKLVLIKLSLFEYISAGFLKEICQEDKTILEDIYKINFFIRYNEVLKVYEFNKLFKEFLYGLHFKLSFDQIQELYVVAASYYKNNDYKIEAIKYYEKCRKYDEIFDVIIYYREFCDVGTATYLLNIIEDAPKSSIDSKPIIRVLHARYLIHVGLFNEALKELLKIRSEFENKKYSEENRYILGETYIILGWISMLTRTYEFIELFRLAVEFLPNGSVIVTNEVQMIPGNNMRLNTNSNLKEIETFEDAYFEAMPDVVKVMNGSGKGLDSLVAAESAYILKNFKRAEEYAFKAIRDSKQENQYGIENIGTFVLIKIALYKGDYVKCTSLLSKLKNRVRNIQHKLNTVQYDVIEGWFYNVVGETTKVSPNIMEEHLINNSSLPILTNEKNILRAQCLLTDAKYYELLAFLEQLIISYKDRDLLIVNINLPIIKAIALYYVGEKENAFIVFEEAYTLSKYSRIIMPFIEYGTKMRTLIHSLRQSENCKIPKSWLDNIYSKSSTYAKQIGKITEAYKKTNNIQIKKTTELTKRELEVLTSLCHGLTREQIALGCNLSINTVKSVLQNIYSKLGATNKSDAIYIATTMNLLKQ